MQAIRAFCIACQGGSSMAVADCADATCAFHKYRHGKVLEVGRHRPFAAIRAFCIACAGREVINCQGDHAEGGSCLLFPYRLGAEEQGTLF